MMSFFLKPAPTENHGTWSYFFFVPPHSLFCRSLAWSQKLGFRYIEGLHGLIFHFDADGFSLKQIYTLLFCVVWQILICVFLQILSSESGQQVDFLSSFLLVCLALIFVRWNQRSKMGTNLVWILRFQLFNLRAIWMIINARWNVKIHGNSYALCLYCRHLLK